MIRRVNVPLMDAQREPIRRQDVELPGRVLRAEVVEDDPEKLFPQLWLKLLCLDVGLPSKRVGLYAARTDEELPRGLFESLRWGLFDAEYVTTVRPTPRDLHVFLGPPEHRP